MAVAAAVFAEIEQSRFVVGRVEQAGGQARAYRADEKVGCAADGAGFALFGAAFEAHGLVVVALAAVAGGAGERGPDGGARRVRAVHHRVAVACGIFGGFAGCADERGGFARVVFAAVRAVARRCGAVRVANLKRLRGFALVCLALFDGRVDAFRISALVVAFLRRCGAVRVTDLKRFRVFADVCLALFGGRVDAFRISALVAAFLRCRGAVRIANHECLCGCADICLALFGGRVVAFRVFTAIVAGSPCRGAVRVANLKRLCVDAAVGGAAGRVFAFGVFAAIVACLLGCGAVRGTNLKCFRVAALIRRAAVQGIARIAVVTGRNRQQKRRNKP